MKIAIDAVLAILNTAVTLEGFTFTWLQLLIFLGFVGLLCFFIGGALR